MPSKKLIERIRRWAFAIVGLLMCMACGCPDTSYQAPVPDYSNMTDGGGDDDDTDSEYIPPGAGE